MNLPALQNPATSSACQQWSDKWKSCMVFNTLFRYLHLLLHNVPQQSHTLSESFLLFHDILLFKINLFCRLFLILECIGFLKMDISRIPSIRILWVISLQRNRTLDQLTHTGNIRCLPAAIAWIMTLPIAVASDGPATTGMPIALAVNWFNKSLRLPPPITCRFRPDEEKENASSPTPDDNAKPDSQRYNVLFVHVVPGTGCPVVRQYSEWPFHIRRV